MKKRIALYGGTFDPVHSGHLEIARKISELFEIEKVLFIPAQVAPHKVGKPVTAPIHRYAMLALATQNDPQLSLSTFELDAPNRRYTVDTVEHFQTTLGDSAELFFIMGADSWAEIRTWREWERLLQMIDHIVVTRPGHDVNKTLPSSDARVSFTDAVMKDISSSGIRRVAAAGEYAELAQLVPAPVAEYIRKYELYRDTNETELHS
ncbi:MAG TPA: nicotinate-nucleotide adenylyltransferase [Pyrinomonadaceae bacterium]|jgi:nicotinate-nucleotide adenylyltransferase|nr:nicotinate-nucleotide adenylyltransferase [Pyrinomonadaceae bacterium]